MSKTVKITWDNNMFLTPEGWVALPIGEYSEEEYQELLSSIEDFKE